MLHYHHVNNRRMVCKPCIETVHSPKDTMMYVCTGGHRCGHLALETKPLHNCKRRSHKSLWCIACDKLLHDEFPRTLTERLKVIKAAWFKEGGLSQSWLKEKGRKREILSRIGEGLAQFKTDGVPLPAGLPEAALATDFDFHRCLDMFGLKNILGQAASGL